MNAHTLENIATADTTRPSLVSQVLSNLPEKFPG